jgi:hypothetical protein
MAADCIVVPSVSEGFGYSAMEAATLGWPAVATSGHPVEEILGDALHLMPPRDPESLAAIVGVAKSGPALLPRARYEIDAHVEGVLAVYDRVLGGTPA